MAADEVAQTVARLCVAAGLDGQAEVAALFCCGADLASDIDQLEAAFQRTAPARSLLVDNDTFALLHAGRRCSDTVAVVCGAGMNVVGQDSAGRTLRYPSLGWETGDWGGAEAIGREALFLAARARDGRGQPSVIPEVVERHFAAPLAQVAADVHYRRMPATRLGQLAPAVVAAATHDPVAASLVDRLAGEIALMAWRALRDLGALAGAADVVLGGGMLASGVLRERATAALAAVAPHAQVIVPDLAPVAGSVLKALEMAGAAGEVGERFRERFGLAGPPVTLT
jgi:N-acetylglucosamine kinase-like BadF-type ATPase